MDYIFVTGKASFETLSLVFNKIFQVVNFQIMEPKFDYQISENLTVVVDCDLGTLNFNLNDYKHKANLMRPNLKAIICLDSLNPRPDSLFTNVELLAKVFDSNELNMKTFFLFTYYNRELTQDIFRKDAMEYNTIYESFRIPDRENFVENKIWLINDEMLENFRNFLNQYNQIRNSSVLETSSKSAIHSNLIQFLIALILIALFAVIAVILIHSYYYCVPGLVNNRCLFNITYPIKSNGTSEEAKNNSTSYTLNQTVDHTMSQSDWEKLLCESQNFDSNQVNLY